MQKKLTAAGIMLLVGVLVGCQPDAVKHKFQYCALGSDTNDAERAIFDLDNFRLLGSDTSYFLEILENELAKGFVSPFPLSLPLSSTLDAGKPEKWVFGEFQFSMTALNEARTDWVLIDARPIAENVRGPSSVADRYSSVLYSAKSGVLAITIHKIPDPEKFKDLAMKHWKSELLICGQVGFHASDFRSVK